jgi:hypothetical protein
LAPPTYLAAPEVADYHAIALCEHVAGGDIGVSALTYARVSSTLMSDLLSNSNGYFRWCRATGSILESASYVRIVRYLRFFSLFFSTRPKEFF